MIYPCQTVEEGVDGAKFDGPQPCNTLTLSMTFQTILYVSIAQIKPS